MAGVLLTNGWDRGERAAAIDNFHLDLEAFESRQLAPYDAWERGWTPVTDYLDATVFYEPRSFTSAEFLAAICARSQLLPDGAFGILQELSAPVFPGHHTVEKRVADPCRAVDDIERRLKIMQLLL